MRVEDRIRKAIVYVGRGDIGSFQAFGTGFIAVNFIGDKGFQSVVTARHVIERIPGDEVHVRINKKDGEATVRSENKSQWFFHKDDRVDVAVCCSAFSHQYFDIMHLKADESDIVTNDIISQYDIGIGDEVYFAGMFISRLGETRNLPILRMGTIAAMPEERIETKYGYHDAYLIEARSIDGLSGSPVFIRLPIWVLNKDEESKSYMPRMHTGRFEFFMGMLLGTNEAYDPVEMIEIVKRPADAEDYPPVVRLPLNTGIGVVLPLHYVFETLDRPEIRDARVATLKSSRTDRRFRATSAYVEEPEPPTTDDNPQHKEDFTRLLNAAAAGRKEGKET